VTLKNNKIQKGFTYLSLLIMVAVMGGGLAAFGELASHAAQREKEVELLFRGDQFRQAIGAYYRKEQRYPQVLEDLLEDRRYPMPVRHLRRIYPDPLSGGTAWGLVTAPSGGIMGVHSLSEAAPIKSGNFASKDVAFEGAARYSDWQFVYLPPPPPPGVKPAASG
jgi:type II secretory pathway pseudopilin PulG